MDDSVVIDSKEHTFITETDAKLARSEYTKSFIIVFLAFSALACAGFLIAWQTFVFFEAIVLISMIASYIATIRKSHSYTLCFEGDQLNITNQKTQESYVVYDIPATDFVITQSSKEKEMDYCGMMIKNTVFGFAGVKQCQKLKEYIANHFE